MALQTGQDTVIIDIPHADGVRFSSTPPCLPGTRKDILDEIEGLLDGTTDSDDARIILLTGVAGSGKSAIASAVAQRLDARGILGSSFFFNRLDDGKNRTSNVFSTIARDISGIDGKIKHRLWQMVRYNDSLRKTESPREQFENFIFKPTEGLTIVGPVVVVMDALDECGDPGSRKELLKILADYVPKLPGNFRFLITARPDVDIVQSLGFVHRMAMDKNIDRISTDADIKLFLQWTLTEVANDFKERWPKDIWVDELVKRSGGLFQWASTSCRFIEPPGEGGVDSVERLQILLDGTAHGRHLNAMDSLYSTVLKALFKDRDAIQLFNSVMGKLLAVKVPLSKTALRDLFEDDRVTSQAIDLVIPYLGSFLCGVSDLHVPLAVLHLSFNEFLMDRQRSQAFFVDVTVHKEQLAYASLEIISRNLKRDTFGREVVDLSIIGCDDETQIPRYEALSYAGRFWGDHVVEGFTYSSVEILWDWLLYIILTLLGFFARKSDQISFQELSPTITTLRLRPAREHVHDFLRNHLLHWIELLSLTGQLSTANKTLEQVMEWSKVQ
jgi:hypothetical protein